MKKKSDGSRKRTIAEGAAEALGNVRAEAAEELAFVRAVFAKLPADAARVREKYGAMGAEMAERLDELDTELAALEAVRDELAHETPAIVVGNGAANP